MKKFTLALSAIAMCASLSVSAQFDATPKLICKANFRNGADTFGHYITADENNAVKMLNDNTSGAAQWVFEAAGDGSDAYTIKNVQTQTYLYTVSGSNAAMTSEPTVVYVHEYDRIPGASVLTTTKDAALTDNVFLNIDGASGNLQFWSADDGCAFVIMDYVEGVTDEEIQAQLLTSFNRADRVEYIKTLLNSSSMGKQNGEDMWFRDIENAAMTQTDEEFEETCEGVIGYAMRDFLGELQFGVQLINKRNGRYLTADVDNDETPFVCNSDFSYEAFWIADLLDAYDGFISWDNVRFRLRNAITGEYLGVQTTSSAAVPSVPTAEEAAIYTLVAGDGGVEIKYHSSADGVATETLFLNASNNASDLKLCVYDVESDGGNYWMAYALPSLSRGETSMEFVGDKHGDEFSGFTYSNFDAIQLIVRDGAVATDLGEISCYTYDAIGNSNVFYTAKVKDLIANENCQVSDTVINMYVGLDETFMPIFEELSMKVYRLPLDKVYEDYGSYRCTMTAGAFSVEVDGETLYTPQVEGYGEITKPIYYFDFVITPAAGNIDEFVNITLSLPEGNTEAISVNPDGPEYANVTLTHDWSKDTGEVDEFGPVYEYGYETVLDISASEMQNYDTQSFDDPTAPCYTFPVNTSAFGNYTLSIPSGFFINSKDEINNDIFVFWTIAEKDGIKTITNVKVNGQVIYDINGRRVNNATKGIYIINGKKTLVR